MGYTYRRRRSGPNWGLITSLVLVAGAAAYFVPQYMNPQAGPPPPPFGSDAAPASAAAPIPSTLAPIPPAARLPEADKQLADGHWTMAATIYGDVARVAPNLTAAHAGWARALIYANKAADAIEHAQRAADLEPKSAELQALLALAFDWSGNVDRALTSARRATELDPKLAEGWAYLAEAETDKFKLKEASDALDRATAVGGRDNPEVLRIQAYLAETNADYPGAVDLYKRAVEKAPERSYLHLSLGHALRASKQYDEAIQAFQQAADLNPDDARAE
ncbi:MAG TPA: tetratricopeptide repeat protein, partial [Chloroflexota bacterium]|nr:tetratricopeptide repeat protein [Chloroflexota bacterium]